MGKWFQPAPNELARVETGKLRGGTKNKLDRFANLTFYSRTIKQKRLYHFCRPIQTIGFVQMCPSGSQPTHLYFRCSWFLSFRLQGPVFMSMMIRHSQLSCLLSIVGLRVVDFFVNNVSIISYRKTQPDFIGR